MRILTVIMLLVLFLCSPLEAPAKPKEGAVEITVIYPQKSNAPKRENKKKDGLTELQGKVLVEAVGINPQQLKSPALYVEYFLDSELIYSSKETGGLSFHLDTALYDDGEHVLVVNLWDEHGPSAIGIRKVTFKNGHKK